jgi:hypothetical protein
VNPDPVLVLSEQQLKNLTGEKRIKNFSKKTVFLFFWTSMIEFQATEEASSPPTRT